MGPYDDLGQVGLLQQGVEEGVWIRQTPSGNDGGVGGRSIPPIFAQ